jgi:hypothetical protein
MAADERSDQPNRSSATAAGKAHGAGQRARAAGPSERSARESNARAVQAQGGDDEARVVRQAAGDPGNDQDRAGVDARRRGWFWHWNSVVTQYAPLIGLKGVGLLNSYTVWTDRRDESPHRGFAFPSQQAEADFYGEERAELITINKILVALDLIEIRKEMLLRTDERGRRWRVPHNLYRVKDRQDSVALRADDVLHVAELARADAAVFRYVRRVFSSRFKPIDRDNVWATILEEVSRHPTWRELQARAAEIESRASARTRAGHHTRSTQARRPSSDDAERGALTGGHLSVAPLPNGEQRASGVQRGPTTVDHSNDALGMRGTAVAAANEGSVTAAAAASNGLAALDAAPVDPGNTGHATVVAATNTTYDQDNLTTTTTTTAAIESRRPPGLASTVATPSPAQRGRSAFSTRPAIEAAAKAADDEEGTAGSAGGGDMRSAAPWVRAGGSPEVSGPADRPSGSDVGACAGAEAGWLAGEDGGGGIGVGAVNASELAEPDGGVARDLEVGGDAPGERRWPVDARAGGDDGQRHLAGADGGGPLGDPSPLVVSIFESANDRRATPLERVLLAELECYADPAARAAGTTGAGWVVAAVREAVASGSSFVAPKRIREIIARWASESESPPARPAGRLAALSSGPPLAGPPPAAPAVVEADTPDVRLPGGASGAAVWSAVLAELRRALDGAAFERLLAGSAVSRCHRGTVEIRVASPGAADKLAAEYRPLVERHLNARLRRPVTVRFVHATLPSEHASSAEPAGDRSTTIPAPTGLDVALAPADLEVGRQVWHSLLPDLARGVSPDDLDRLADVVVLGADERGSILLGVPTVHAGRLVEGRCRAAIEASLAALCSRPAAARAVPPGRWGVDTTPDTRR